MIRGLEKLDNKTQALALNVEHGCRERGVDLLIYCTLRTCEEQARLYRQSRERARIAETMERLRARGFDFLADVLDRVGPQGPGPNVTNAAPGESWHQYGAAFDAVPLVNGKPVWVIEHAPEAWRTYGKVVAEWGGYWAGDWSGKMREYPHTESRPGNPLMVLSPGEAHEILKRLGSIAA